MKIGFLSAHNPLNRYSFSGSAYYAYEALLRLPNVSTYLLGNQFHSRERMRHFTQKFLSKVPVNTQGYSKRLKEKSAKDFLNSIESDLRKNQIDVVVCFVSSSLVSPLKSKSHLPFISVTDATVSYIEDAYNYPVEPEDYRHEYESIQKSSRVVFSSDFMADRVRGEYADLLREAPKKVRVIPFGLNMDLVSQAAKVPLVRDQLNLLFVGREWHRKGGDIAIEMLKYLQANHVNAHLTIIGSRPEIAEENLNITVIPYLDKNKPEQQQQYFDILNRTHFLVLPTRADCTPMVIAEANAFGVPALVSDVGGTGTLVKPGLNGYLLPATARGDQYGAIAAKLFADRTGYQNLSMTSRKEYETRLNWDAWARQIYQLSNEVMGYGLDLWLGPNMPAKYVAVGEPGNNHVGESL